MANIKWDDLSEIKQLVLNDEFPANSEKVDRLLNAVMETIADTLPSANAQALYEGAATATGALNGLKATESIDRQSANFAAGRLAAAIDVLGYAASVTAHDDDIVRARQQPYAVILQLLSDAPLRNVDLVQRLGIHKSQASRWLADLREMQMVTSHQNGREIYNALTPAGRLVVEEGIERDNRADLGYGNIHALKPYSLAERVGPDDVQPTVPALLRAC